MTRALLAAAALGLAACASLSSPPQAGGTHFYAFDPASELSRRLTRGVTLEVERGLLGGARVVRFYSTTATGSAPLERGGLSDAQRRAALPEGAEEANAYAILPEDDGPALTRALCPGSDRAWLVVGRVRPLRDLRMHAVGQVRDAAPVLCATLDYRYRGEFARPVREAVGGEELPPAGR